MRLLLSLLTFFIVSLSWSQSADNYVKKIERLRNDGKLTTKSSADKTFVGSLTGYYFKDSLVLINSLTDGETAGTENLYYIQHGRLKKVYTMEAQLNSNEDWTPYIRRHGKAENCFSCHGELNCIVTTVTFGKDATIIRIKNGTEGQVAKSEGAKVWRYITKTTDELKKLLKKL